MPIILVSVDSENLTLERMNDIVIDIVLESTDPRSKDIGDMLSNKVVFINRIATDRLNEESDEEPSIRMQAVLNMIRQMKVHSAMIISHRSVFDSWQSGIVEDEWNVIPM
jgi:hypothetical protein